MPLTGISGSFKIRFKTILDIKLDEIMNIVLAIYKDKASSNLHFTKLLWEG